MIWRETSERTAQRGDAVVAGSSLRGDGYRVNAGTSFVMTVDYTGDDVEAWALDAEIAADPNIETYTVVGR